LDSHDIKKKMFEIDVRDNFWFFSRRGDCPNCPNWLARPNVLALAGRLN
jgi:hypothetical protein